MTIPIAATIDIPMKYIKIYNEIYAPPTGGRWLTLSPPYSNNKVECLDSMYMDTIQKLLKCSKELIGVREFSSMRLHYHICYLSTNAKAEYIILNQMRKEHEWQVCWLKGPPKQSLAYLFKDYEESLNILGYDPVFTRLDLMQQKKLHLIQKRI